MVNKNMKTLFSVIAIKPMQTQTTMRLTTCLSAWIKFKKIIIIVTTPNADKNAEKLDTLRVGLENSPTPLENSLPVS